MKPAQADAALTAASLTGSNAGTHPTDMASDAGRVVMQSIEVGARVAVGTLERYWVCVYQSHGCGPNLC
jgi:hypothetical protein